MVGRDASRTITPSLSSTKKVPTLIAASTTSAQNASNINDSMAISRFSLVCRPLPDVHCKLFLVLRFLVLQFGAAINAVNVSQRRRTYDSPRRCAAWHDSIDHRSVVTRHAVCCSWFSVLRFYHPALD